MPKARILGVFGRVFLKMENYLRTSRNIRRDIETIGVLTARAPTHPITAGGALSEYFDLFGHHKGTIKAHTELPNKLRIRLLIAGQIRKEFCGTRFCNGA